MDASSWFLTETMSFKQSEEAYDHLGWLLAQGWQIASQTTNTTVDGQVWSWIDGVSPPSGTPYPSFESAGYSIVEVFVAGDESTASGYFRGRYSDVTSSDTTFGLTRRKLQSERVLQDMITEFTDAYNEGRTINDSRYDELVTLWATLAGNVEDDINALNTNETNYVALLDAVVAQLPTDFDTYQDYVEDLLDGWGDSMRADLTERFDNLLAAARQDLVTRGMYNTTVWTSTNVGIERERQIATTDLEDKILERLLASKDQEQRFLVDMRNGTLAAYSRILGIRQDNVLRPLDVRNRILTSMFNFMERRQDDYPDLGNLANIAAQLGYSDTQSTVAAD
jgi:hypothetical protein